MKPRILLIDDEPQIRRFMRLSLIAENFDYLEAGNAAEGLACINQNAPNLVILDLGLPDRDGFTLLRDIRRASLLPVLVLSARDTEQEKVRLLEAGANDYLTKPFGIHELIARIRVLLRDLPTLTDTPVKPLILGTLTLDIPNHTASINGDPLNLSPKEFALLGCLAQHAGMLLTHTYLLNHIWGEYHTEDTHYLRILVSQLRKKLKDEADTPRFIQNEPGVGYRFIDPSPGTTVNG